MTKPKRRTRTWTDEQKAAALALLASNGGNVKATVRQFVTAGGVRISESTLRDFRNKPAEAPPAELVHDASMKLADVFESVASKVVRGLDRPEAINRILSKPVQAMTVAGIAVDKLRILRNEPTSIVDGPFGQLLLEIRAMRMKPLQVIEGGKDKREAAE